MLVDRQFSSVHEFLLLHTFVVVDVVCLLQGEKHCHYGSRIVLYCMVVPFHLLMDSLTLNFQRDVIVRILLCQLWSFSLLSQYPGMFLILFFLFLITSEGDGRPDVHECVFHVVANAWTFIAFFKIGLMLP